VRLLLIEDEPALRRLVRERLQAQGLTVAGAATIVEATAALRAQDFDVVILDLTLPDGSGLDLLVAIRDSGTRAHVITLSGAGTEADRVRALELGADDDVTKPFSIRELSTRVLGVERRLDPNRDATLRAGSLAINLRSREVTAQGQPVETTAKEFDLLAFLVARPGIVFSREDLLRSVWSSAPGWQLDTTVTEHVRRLRTKIELDPRHPRLLRTVRGAGYRFDAPGAAAEPPVSESGTVIHIDGRIVAADDAATLLLGGDACSSVVGRHLFEFVAPGSMAAAKERMRVGVAGGLLRSQIVDIRYADGSEVSFAVSSATTDWNGERAGRVVLEPIVDPGFRLRHLVTGITCELTDAVIITDVHAHIRSWNKAAERLYGWPEHEVLGRHVLDVLDVDGQAPADASSVAWQALEVDGYWHGELQHRSRDGSTVDVRASTSLVLDESGQPVGVVSVNRPVIAGDHAADAGRSDGPADQLDAEIRHGIDSGEFEVYFQPIVGLGDLHIVTLEALVRWNHPERGLLSPVSFIDAAERSGLILELGAFVLDGACRQASAWRRDGFDIDVAVNLSTRELGDATLVDRVTATLAAAELDASSLWLEVTETGLVEDVRQAREVLEHLTALGVGVAIDDFGTGWASLTYLKEFPVRALKIDRSFVDGVAGNSHSAAIIRSILSLGHELGLVVVAEGIETEAQQHALQDLGCTIGQGYLYARPVPASEVPIHRANRTADAPTLAVSTRAPHAGPRVGSRRAPLHDRDLAPAGAISAVAVTGLPGTADVFDESPADTVAATLRGLLRIRSARGAAELVHQAIHTLGGMLVLASDAATDALPIDVSLGVGPPLLVTVEPFSVARMQLERILPVLVDDARQALHLLRQTESLEEQSPA